MKKKICIILTALLFCTTLTGCTSFFSIGSAVGLSGSQHGTVMNARFSSLNGSRGARFKLDQGDTIRINYELVCEDGSLTLTFEDKDGNILFTNSETTGVKDITVETSQRYTLRLTAVKAKGSYDLTWSVNP